MIYSFQTACKSILRKYPDAKFFRTLGEGKGGIVIETLLKFQNSESIEKTSSTSPIATGTEETEMQPDITTQSQSQPQLTKFVERMVAIKVVKKKFREKCVESEVYKKITEELPNSNYLSVPLEIVKEQLATLFVLPLYEFGSLFDYQSKGNSFTKNQIKSLIRQTALALAELEKIGITHFDVKPENIMIESINPLKIRLIDFDRCNIQIPNQKSFYNITDGTPLYMAPEIYYLRYSHDVVEVQTNCSIWSLGTTFANMISAYSTFIPTWVALEHFYLDIKNDSFYHALKEFRNQLHSSTSTFDLPDGVYENREKLSLLGNQDWKDCLMFLSDMIVYKPEGRPSLQKILEHQWLAADENSLPFETTDQD